MERPQSFIQELRASAPSREPEAKVLADITQLQERMRSYEAAHASLLVEVARTRQQSARNLLHYLALRSTDIRDLQEELTALGLSSLGRAEAHAEATVRAVESVLRRLVGKNLDDPATTLTGPSVSEGRHLLAEHTQALLGPAPPGRRVRIMVTMPSEAADGPQLIEDLVAAGMDLMRINCAHDDATRWGKMIEHLEAAKKRLGRPCRVFMDLAGPKLRTGPLELEGGIVHWRPQRDSAGRAVGPARIWLHLDSAPPRGDADANLPVGRTWLKHLEPGMRIAFSDLRGRPREMRVVLVESAGAWAESHQSSYVDEGIELTLARGSEKKPPPGRVGKLAPRERPIALERGDILVLTRSLAPGHAARRDGAGRILEHARVGCTLEAAFRCARAGEAIWFDDGKIGGVIRRVDAESMEVEITHVKKARVELGSDKGINLPDTEIAVGGLTEKDAHDLEFVAEHADGVGMSFVRSEDDVRQLERALRHLRARADFGVVLKIETRRGFENLPAVLLAAMGGRPVGVMIARGDLAIECGYERMAELQEEILWVSEAAHVPAIWATQVLETLAKKGVPSRAEITDAAMGERAECVMLNKGPHVVEAVRALDDILRRMGAHQEKKSSKLRGLRLAGLLREVDEAGLGT